MNRTAIVVFLAVCAGAADKPAKFEVASIKPSAPGSRNCGSPLSSPLQFTVQGCTTAELVRNAWSLNAYEASVPAEPAWISSARYDIVAKSSSPVNPGDHWQMLQTLLTERFGLKVHHERRQLPVYYLSASKTGLRLLPATKAGDCVPFDHKAPPHPPIPGQSPYCDYIAIPFTKDGLGAKIDATQVSMTSFAQPLSLLLGRTVIDKTGFTGTFDLHLLFAKDSIPMMNSVVQSGEPTGLPSIFTAVHEVGLNLESGKGPVDVLVVDSVQRPLEN